MCCTACNSAQIGRIDVVVSATPFHWSINGRRGRETESREKGERYDKKEIGKMKSEK